MQYLDEAEIQRPPHPNFPAAKLTTLGIEEEAIALLRYFPYIIDQLEITPMSLSYSYLHGSDEAREVLWERGNDLAPWAVRLAEVCTMPGHAWPDHYLQCAHEDSYAVGKQRGCIHERSADHACRANIRGVGG